MKIDDYSYGSITVDGKIYHEDIIIFPDWVHQDWWRKEAHSLSLEDLLEVVNFKPDILVVGRGSSGIMKIPLSTKDALKDLDIELIEGDSVEAARVFNLKAKLGKRVVGAFHLTC